MQFSFRSTASWRLAGSLLRVAAAAVTLVVVLFAAPFVAPLSAQADASGITMQPGDVIRISVWRRPELSGEYVVGPDGTITHPLYRVVHVAGIPLADIDARLKEFLTQYDAQPAFVFSPLLRVFVVGELHQPGMYTLPPGTTVAQALGAAGGPTEAAQLRDVRLIRGNRIIPLDLVSDDLAAAHTTIQSGDQVTVGRAQNKLRDNIGPIAALFGVLVGIANIAIQVSK